MVVIMVKMMMVMVTMMMEMVTMMTIVRELHDVWPTHDPG